MRHQPSIAVLITYHNEGTLLTECLDSLQQGTQRPEEVLLYDDASEVRPETFIPRGVAARVLRGEVVRGPAHGRNVLWQNSTCEYIHFHDADDLFTTRWCETIRNKIIAKKPEAIFTEVRAIRKGVLVDAPVLGLGQAVAHEDLLRFCIGGSILPASGTYLRDKVREIGGYDETWWQSEDKDFHIRLALAGVRYEIITDPLVTIRVHERSRSQDHKQVFLDSVNMLKLLPAKVPQRYWSDIAETLAVLAGGLYRVGALDEAAEAFRAAQRLGRPVYAGRPWLYRLVSRSIGPLFAERCSSCYRALLPQNLRAGLRGSLLNQSIKPVPKAGQ